jgi:hypothetical protein
MLPPPIEHLDLDTLLQRAAQLCHKAQAVREHSEQMRLCAHQRRRSIDAKIRAWQTRRKQIERHLGQG